MYVQVRHSCPASVHRSPFKPCSNISWQLDSGQDSSREGTQGALWDVHFWEVTALRLECLPAARYPPPAEPAPKPAGRAYGRGGKLPPAVRPPKPSRGPRLPGDDAALSMPPSPQGYFEPTGLSPLPPVSSSHVLILLAVILTYLLKVVLDMKAAICLL